QKPETEKAREEDPVIRFRQYLFQKNFWSEKDEENLKTECEQLVNQAVKDYQSLPPEPISALFDYHYEKLPKDLLEQKEEAVND
ncbi:thiamine pyrophosphate-dependent enzyme, partial [Klebsiella pneumoniae]|nr:thiamine pyrophosphate-dependent enzyme [Klebsiella pneumoniae]